jgi:type III pantothenate kinase
VDCLTVDIGNTTAAIGLALSGRVRAMTRATCAVAGRREAEAAIRRVVGRRPLDGAILASVVPRATSRWVSAVRAVLGQPPLVLKHDMDLGFEMRYPRPAALGADRLANVAGAVRRFGSPVIVADFGTAATFNVVTARREFVGGAIAPGLGLMSDYLADRTALLPRVRPTGRCGRIGRSTAGAMRIGIEVGFRGMVLAITQHLISGMGPGEVTLCATGGNADWVVRGLGLPFVLVPDLTLFGLGCIFERNADAGGRSPRRAAGKGESR